MMARTHLLRCIAGALVCVLLTTACAQSHTTSLPTGDNTYAGSTVRLNNLSLPASVKDERVQLAFGDHFEPRFWPGVNLGTTTAGHAPGELSPTRDDYDRWLREMSLLGVRVVRVYTILRPAFYDALKAFNTANPSRPLYVIHGVWIPEEPFLKTQNAYDDSVVNAFRSELQDAVAAAHGDITIPARAGHADGTYTSDISPWLLAWSIGVEWDPTASASTNQKNASQPPYAGRYIRATADANPMESWIASMMDHIAALEVARGWSRPLTFTNWLTTDPLHHPDEPLVDEDLVSIDAMHMTATSEWPAGMFASYHAYPYYPDFLRTQPSYASYKRPADGVIDPYAGYLNELRAHHRGQAVMITEFGVPTSIGVAHNGPLGRSQGGHSETQAAAQLSEMMSDIEHEGYAGGVIFEWTDEWFKRTWNTIEYELPSDRRQYWRNPLTNEEYFGILAVEPGQQTAVVLDGDASEWKYNNSKVILENQFSVATMRAVHDAEYLYLLIDTETPDALTGMVLGFDVRPGSNGGVDGRKGLLDDADVQIRFTDDHQVSLEQAAWTDPFSRKYGVERGYVNVDAASLTPDSGTWVPIRQPQSLPYEIPSTGERSAFEMSTLDPLPRGTTDPADPHFDNRNLVITKDNITEMRIPWSYLTYSDPSTHQVYAVQPNGSVINETVGGMQISLVQKNGTVAHTLGYDWKNWNTIVWHERKKQGWNELENMFTSAAKLR